MKRKIWIRVSAMLVAMITLISIFAIAYGEEVVDKTSPDYDVSHESDHKFSGAKVGPIPEELKEPDLRGGTKVQLPEGFDFTKPGIAYGSNRNIAQLEWVDLGDGTGCYKYDIAAHHLTSQQVYSRTFSPIKPNRNYLISVLMWADFDRINSEGNTCEGLVNIAVGDENQLGGVNLRMGTPDYTNGWQRFEYVASTGLMETAVSARLVFQTWNFNVGMPEGNIYIADFQLIELPELTDVPVYAEGEGVTFRGNSGSLGMKVENAVETDETITVTTNGAEYIFDKTNDTITANQRINLQRTVSSWHSDIPFKDLKIRSKTDTECVISCPDVTFGVQLDGMVFLTPHKRDIKLTCTSKIGGMWNRFAFGFLTVFDGYGGFTVTPDLPEGTGKLCNYEVLTENLDFTQLKFNNHLGLIDNKENPNFNFISNAKAGWQIAYTISPGERLAISTFPPREYDWENSFEMTYRNMDWKSVLTQYSDDYENFDVRVITIFNASDTGYAREYSPHWTYLAHEAGFKAQIKAAKEAGMQVITYAPAYFYFDKYSPDQYITEITRLKNTYGLDGIYSDGTPSEHQWVTAYEESRMLRELFPDGTLVVHHTGNPANGGPPLSSPAYFIPAIDTYWSATLKAESSAMIGLNDPAAAMTLSQYSAGNVVGICKGDAWYYVNENGENTRVPQADMDLMMLEYNGRARITLHDETFKTSYLTALRTLKKLWQEKGNEKNFYELYYLPKVRELTRDKLKKYGDLTAFKLDLNSENALSQVAVDKTVTNIKEENGEKSLEMRGGRYIEKGSLFKRMKAVSGPMSLSYKFKVNERGDFEHSFSDNFDNPGIGLMFGEDGKFKLKNKDGNYVNICKYNRNEWYEIKMKIDTDKREYSIYLNDMPVIENAELNENVFSFSEVEFTDGGYGSVCEIKDLEILDIW